LIGADPRSSGLESRLPITEPAGIRRGVSDKDGGAARVVLDANGAFDHVAPGFGIPPGRIADLADRVATIVTDLSERRAAGKLPFYDLPYDDASIAACEALAGDLRDRFTTLVVLGIGGSALGTRAAIEAIPADLRAAGARRVEILDNIDPSTLAGVLDSLDLETTVFNVISKSGETPETMAQFMLVRERLKALFGAAGCRKHVVCTTDLEKGILRAIADAEELPTLPVPAGVGGRFSVLSPVGLLPIAFAGLDVRALAAGARAMDERTKSPKLEENLAAFHAAVLYCALNERSTSIHVLMPYSDRLGRLSEWYGQLWAESLGKRHALDGRVVETGQTPARSLGATDQHSQVQLYVEGPRDKLVTFLRVEEHAADREIPAGFPEIEALACLAGHTFGELLNMEQLATEIALADGGRLTTTLVLPRVDEGAIGELFHFFEVQTLVMGGLLGINPLDQPGVEAGKRLTYAMAGRQGYEGLAKEVSARSDAKQQRFIFA
jgi:glucose-6-phosphate isomerase